MPGEKGFFKYTGLDGNEYSLTLKEKAFCIAYLEFKGNGVDAVFEAGYKAKNSLVAAQIAYENLIKPDIFNYVNLLLEEYGFKDDNVEKQHLFLLNQMGDLKSKGRAVDMFYRLKGKYAATKVKFIDENEGLTDEEIQDEINRRSKLTKPGKKSS